MQLTIDTQTDSYEQAIAAVRAAYGRNLSASSDDWSPDTESVFRPAP